MWLVNIDRLLTKEGEWQRVVHEPYYLTELMKEKKESGNDRVVNHLLTTEGEWARLVKDSDHLIQLVRYATEAGKDRLVNHVLTTEGEWQRLMVEMVVGGYNLIDLMEYATEAGKDRLVNHLLTTEGEWERDVVELRHLSDLMRNATEAGKDRVVNHLLTKEGEWARLVNRRFNLEYLMNLVSEADKDRLVNHLLTQEGEWARLVNCRDNFARIMVVSTLESRLRLVRQLISVNDEGQLSLGLNYDLDGLRALIVGVSSEKSPLRLLLEFRDLESFKNKIDEGIQELKVSESRKLGRLFGEARRTSRKEAEDVERDDQCHLGKLPPELLQQIGQFAAPDVGVNDVNKTIKRYLDKPVKSEEASGSAPAATMSTPRG